MGSSAADIAYWVAAGLYALAALILVGGVAGSQRRLVPPALALASVGAVAQAAHLAVVWTEAGPPDPASASVRLALGALVMVVAYLLLAWGRRDVAAAGLVVLPVAVATLGIGGVFAGEAAADAVTRAVDAVAGGWLLLAISLATWTACVLVGGVAVAALTRQPSQGTLGLSARLAAVAFVAAAATLAVGSVSSFRSTGSPWSGAAAEAWMLFALLALALYMHSKLTLGWSRRALAVLALVVALGAVMSLWQVRLPEDTLDTLSFAQRTPVESEEVL